MTRSMRWIVVAVIAALPTVAALYASAQEAGTGANRVENQQSAGSGSSTDASSAGTPGSAGTSSTSGTSGSPGSSADPGTSTSGDTSSSTRQSGSAASERSSSAGAGSAGSASSTGADTSASSTTQSGRRGGMNRQGGRLQDQQLAAWLIIDNSGEVVLNSFALQHASHDQVKQFAQHMVEDHSKFIEQLKPFSQAQGAQSGATTSSSSGAGSAGDSASAQDSSATGGATAAAGSAQSTSAGSGQSAWTGGGRGGLINLKSAIGQKKVELIQRELSQHKGPKFDSCFVGQQIVAHVEMLATLQAMQGQATGELQQLIAQGAQTTQQHLTKAQELMQQLEGQSASTAGAAPSDAAPRVAERPHTSAQDDANRTPPADASSNPATGRSTNGASSGNTNTDRGGSTGNPSSGTSGGAESSSGSPGSGAGSDSASSGTDSGSASSNAGSRSSSGGAASGPQ